MTHKIKFSKDDSMLDATGGMTVRKVRLTTSVVDGHSHTILVPVDDEGAVAKSMHTSQTALAKRAGAIREHSHAWLFHEDTGAMWIGADSGHTHTVEVETDPPTAASKVAKSIADGSVAIAKAVDLVKSSVVRRDAAQAAHDAYIAKVATERKVNRPAATSFLLESQDAEYLRLRVDYSKAHDAVLRPGADAITTVSKAFGDRLETVMKGMSDAEEAFAIEHNMTVHEARKRLTEISPTYRASYQKQFEIENARGAAIAEAEASFAMAVAKLAGDGRREAAETTTARAGETEPLRLLRQHVERLASDQGLDYPHALTKAMREDATTRELYAASQAWPTAAAR